MSTKRRRRKAYPELDFRRLIDSFGGAAALSRELASAGMPVSMKTVAKWAERGRASGTGVIFLLALSRVDSKPRFDLRDFVTAS